MHRRLPISLVTALVLSMPLVAVRASAASGVAPGSTAAVMFAADGMRPDLMERYAAEGVMPTYADLMRRGVRGDNGLVQAFPPNTGVGWSTLATGAYPGE